MTSYQHQNFHIDDEVDKSVEKCFEDLVHLTMSETKECKDISDEEIKRKVAIGLVLMKKEEYKLIKKDKIARKRKWLRYRKGKTNQRKKFNLYKLCLIKSHTDRTKINEVTNISEDSSTSKLDEILLEMEIYD